jgi:hypothetical protein
VETQSKPFLEVDMKKKNSDSGYVFFESSSSSEDEDVTPRRGGVNTATVATMVTTTSGHKTDDNDGGSSSDDSESPHIRRSISSHKRRAVRKEVKPISLRDFIEASSSSSDDERENGVKLRPLGVGLQGPAASALAVANKVTTVASSADGGVPIVKQDSPRRHKTRGGERRSSRKPDVQELLDIARGADDGGSSAAEGAPSSTVSARLPHRHKPVLKAKKAPLVLIERYKELRKLFSDHKDDKDKSALNNARKVFLTNIALNQAIYTDDDLKETLKLAFKVDDKEVIYTILDLFISKRILQAGKLFDLILEKFEETQVAPTGICDRVKKYFYPNPYKERLENVVHSSIDNGTISLKFAQLKRLLVLAVSKHDYNFVAELLGSPLKTPSLVREKSLQLFEIFERKIHEYYATYTKDKKSLFRLVGIKRVFSHSEWLNCDSVPIARIKALAEVSLKHNNILFVEIWIRRRPELLRDDAFMAKVRPKYKEALRKLMLDEHARDGYGVFAITNFLKSDVLRPEDVRGLFSKDELLDIFTKLALGWSSALKKLLRNKYGVEIPLPREALVSSSEEWAQFCVNGEVDKVKAVIANGKFDLSLVRFGSKTLLYYAASYDIKGMDDTSNDFEFPESVLRKPIDEQKKDPHFQILSKNKNEVLRLLLSNYRFTQKDIQDAFNIAYQQGIVKRPRKHLFSSDVQDDQNLQTKYALRGDHGIMRQLVAHNADISIGKSFLGVWRAVTVSYVTGLSFDFIIGVSAELIENYIKIPTSRWYKRYAPWVIAASSALTFQGTGAVLEYYHGTWNPDYFRNNLYDLQNTVLTGTRTTDWKGDLVYGHKLEKKMGRKVGVTASDKAIYDADDITEKNKGLHYQIAIRNYLVYEATKEKADNLRGWALTGRYDKYLLELESVNKKCQYGIPGDNSYSFNTKFQNKLSELFGNEDNYLKLKESILYNRRNRYFFLDLAKGIERGLVKLPLEIKRKVLKMNRDVLGCLERPPMIVPQNNLPFFFGELIDIYYEHTNNRVPLSVLFVAQFFKERKRMGLAIEPTFGEKAWASILHGWDKTLGVVAPQFGINKERAHELIAGTLQATTTFIVGRLNYYEEKLIDEIVDQGVMKSISHLTVMATSSMYALSQTGANPLWIGPVVVGVMAFMYCRHNDIHPTRPFVALYNAYKEARKPVKDRTGIFISRETKWKFDALFRDLRINKIPAQVHFAM